MATEIDDVGDLADLSELDIENIGDLDDDPAGKRGPGKKRLFLIIGIVVLIAAASGGYYYMSTGSSDSSAANKGSDSAKEEADDESDEADARPTAYYFSLNPPFVVNFIGKGQARFLQVNISGLTRDASVKEEITLHLPHIRNNIVLLLSGKTYDDLITTEGKEALRKEVLTEVKKILRDETGKDEIEDIFFTSFVMQ
ncbi:MAG: flagellar basal body-associated protein FliL [Gammaproteobacteria bacterium]